MHVEQNALQRLGILAAGSRVGLQRLHHQAGDLAAPGARGGGLGCGGQLLALQDQRLDLAQPARWFDAELVDEDTAGISVHSQRFCLPSAAVQGQHELAAQRLAQGVRVDERSQLADQICVPAERKVRVDPVTEHRQSQLFQPTDLDPGERLVADVGECRSAPETEGLPQRGRSPQYVAARQLRPSGDRQGLESVRVERAGSQLERIAGPLVQQDLRSAALMFSECAPDA